MDTPDIAMARRTMTTTIKTAALALALAGLLGGCAAPRLQRPGEAFNEVSKGNQAQLEAQCGPAGPQALECRRRVREEFEALRQKNTADAR